ncbi:MAG TPA: F0F1 ATP synthase subunit B [Nonomuraea sp.]|nr:F0F1 ATP synthase subunit B [Nonomuraea sp.]
MLRLAYSLFTSEGVEGVEEEEEDDIFLIPDATMLVELVLLAIVLTVVWKYVVPPVSAAMAERREKIARSNADTEAAARKLADAQAAYENAMADARAEANSLREQARAQHKAIVDEAAAVAQARADEITAATRAQLTEERDRALASLQSDVSALAGQLAGRVVGEQV